MPIHSIDYSYAMHSIDYSYAMHKKYAGGTTKEWKLVLPLSQFIPLQMEARPAI